MSTLLSPALIDSMAQAFLDGGRTLQSNLQTVAQSLLGSLLLLQMSWFGVQALLESMVGDNLGEVLARLLRLILLYGLVAWFLAAYDLVFYQAIYGGCTALVQAVAGANGEQQSFATAWNVVFDLMLSVWNTMEATPANVLAGSSPLSWSFYATLAQMAVTLVILFGTLCGFLRCLFIVALVHVLGAALVGLALALGPFFIPWLLWGATRSLFEGWLRFLFTASFYRVVAVTLLQLAKPVFIQLQQVVSSGGDPTQATSPLDLVLSAMMLLLLTTVLGDLIGRIPQLSAALLGHGRIDVGTVGNFTRAADNGLRRLTSTDHRYRPWSRHED